MNHVFKNTTNSQNSIRGNNVVSVVIPAFNAEETISEVVHAAREQDVTARLEVIVVDDGSTDQTANQAEQAGAKVLQQSNQGPAAARNAGWRAAQGEVVLFTDSDCKPHNDWAKKLLNGFTNPGDGAVAGSYGIWNPYSWLARNVHEEIKNRHAKMGGSIRVFGSYNVAIKKEVLEKLNGFDENYRRASGEDNDLSYRMLKAGFTIGFRPEALVDHLHQESIVAYLKEQARHGYYRMLMYCTPPEMITGDDYTRLKDIVEPPLALILLVSGILSLFLHGVFSFLFLGLALAYCLLQFLDLMGKGWHGAGSQRWLYAGVTFIRGFARGLGMVAGLLRFGLNKPSNQ
jgi:glycosyltransferase involved in cell wall biosynthesis